MGNRITREDESGIVTVTLNRPEKMNGLDLEMVHELCEMGRRLRGDKSVRVVILRGAGPCFCAGLDFAKVTKQPAGIMRAFLKPIWRDRNAFQQCCWVWRELPVPVIAAVHGHCYGGGLQIALAADFRFARADAQLSVMEIKWGLIPDLTGTKTLSELVPMDIAKELTMTGRVISGTEAQALGLVTRLAEDPLAAAQELAAELVQKSPDALAGIKKVFHENRTADESAALANERSIQARILMGQNQRRAMQAGLRKQPAKFRARQFDFS